MIERYRNALNVFLSQHAKDVAPTREPRANLQFFHSPEQGIISFSREDILNELDSSSPLVIKLLTQISTYNCERERIVGLIFNKQEVLSEVLMMPGDMCVEDDA